MKYIIIHKKLKKSNTPPTAKDVPALSIEFSFENFLPMNMKNIEKAKKKASSPCARTT